MHLILNRYSVPYGPVDRLSSVAMVSVKNTGIQGMTKSLPLKSPAALMGIAHVTQVASFLSRIFLDPWPHVSIK